MQCLEFFDSRSEDVARTGSTRQLSGSERRRNTGAGILRSFAPSAACPAESARPRIMAWGVLTVISCAVVTADEPVTDDQPLPPALAAASMQVPEGFHVTLFAGEPDVRQPIAFCIDDRARLWVAEAYNYPHHTTDPGDRVVIFEDTDHDGKFDKHTVFYDQLNYVTGIEVGFGGAWVMSPPSMYFIPDGNGDDVPDGDPQVILDGFGTHANAHNLANGFAWGPDGWLYGTHGRTNWSMLGRPGTPDEQRVQFDGGVFRYHPVRHVWEPYCDGTTNPWGIDWNDFGHAFICNCVNPHLFQAIQGAHFEPWRNRKSSEFAYERIPTIADHLHFVGTGNVRDGLGTAEEDTAGGGHAHCGTMIYLGDNWPETYRNSIFMNNIHGRRINHDILQRRGSGYVASHGSDLMKSADPWFMGVTLAYNFDGTVFVSDWSDTGECHSVRNTRRHTGRIYRIGYGKPVTESVNIAAQSSTDLVTLHLHANDRFVRHARRVLQERASRGEDMDGVHRALVQMYQTNPDVTRRLRALWTLHTIGGLSDSFLADQLHADSEHIRAWAIRLLCEDGHPSQEACRRFLDMAKTGDSALVRLYLTSAMQRMKAADRWPLAEALAGREEDLHDPNLPLMLWYAVEPLIEDDLPRYVSLACSAQISLIRRHVARRIVSTPYINDGLPELIARLPDVDAEHQSDLLQGIVKGLEGRRSYLMPENWPGTWSILRFSRDAEIRRHAMQLALIFSDPTAIAFLQQSAADQSQSAEDRIAAIEALASRQVGGLEVLLLQQLDDPVTRKAALRALAEYERPDTAIAVLSRYGSLDGAEKQQALQTLSSRVTWARQLMNAIESMQVPREDITAFTARQLASLPDRDLAERLRSVWGNVRETSADRKRSIEQMKRLLTADTLQQADVSSGRALFVKHCATCHRFFGTGGTIGPDITGSQRRNLDYMLENLIDPSATVSRDFQMEILETKSGRVLTGLVTEETDQAITMQTLAERLVIPVDEVESRRVSSVSMMPEGQLKLLSRDDVRDLMGYLSSPQQVPLPSMP